MSSCMAMKLLAQLKEVQIQKKCEKNFYTISNGGYSKLLFDLFGKERVEKELEQFLSLPFFPRVGGGIGMTRMINAFKQMNEAKV